MNQFIVADLHMHTTRSDGFLSYQEIAATCKNLGLLNIAVTDHDTLVTKEMQAHFNECELNLINGTEISTFTVVNAKSYKVDMLLYNYSLENESYFYDLMSYKKEMRAVWISEFSEKILSDCPKFSLTKICITHKLNAVDEIHEGLIYQELKELKLLPDYKITDFYRDYMADETHNPKFLQSKVNIDELLQIRNNIGGFISFAHPLYFLSVEEFNEVAPSLLAAGIRGMEVIHPSHQPEHIEKLTSFANQHDLVITGGSDFHGRANTTLGKYGLNANYYHSFIKQLGVN